MSILILASIVGFSQGISNDFNVRIGEAAKGVKNSTYLEIVGKNSSAVLVLSEDKNKYALDKYDKSMNKVASYPIVLKNGKQKVDYEFSIELDNTVKLFTSYKDKKTKVKYLYRSTISKSSTQSNNKFVKMATIDYSTGKKRIQEHSLTKYQKNVRSF